MATFNIPCSSVILPTPAELTNIFIQMSNSPIDEIRDALDDIDKLLGNFPISIPHPVFDELDIPEIEWEMRVNAMVKEYHLYVGTKIAELIDKVIPLPSGWFVITVAGIQVDVLKMWSDPSYMVSLKKITCENLDTIYALVPEQYKSMNGKYGFDNKELQCDVAFSYIMSQLQGGLLGFIKMGISGAIEEFKDIWNEIGGSSFSDTFVDPTSLIQNIIDDETKSIKEKLELLKGISIGDFSLLDFLGGEFDTSIDIAERDMRRLLDKLQDAIQEFPTYLYKQYMEGIADFLDAIGLGKVLEFITFDFCDFLELIGMPKSITLESVLEIAPLTNSSVASLPTISNITVDRSGSLKYIATQGQTTFSGPDIHGNSGLNNSPSFVFINGRKKIPGVIPSSEVLYQDNSIIISAGTNEGDTIFILD